VWRDILVSNREEILKQSLRFRHTLDAIEHVIRSGNGEALEDLIRQSADARASWQMSAGAKTPGSR
jgi:prephenate dehydrogenase